MNKQLAVLLCTMLNLEEDLHETFIILCIFRHNWSAQNTAHGTTRQLQTPPLHSYIQETHPNRRVLNARVKYTVWFGSVWTRVTAGSDNTASHLSRIDVTDNFDLLIKTNSPESCQAYLMNLEKRGNPHTDSSLLNKLKDCYSKVFSKLPIRQFSKNASYAKILVRYAELRGWVWVRVLKHHFSLGFRFFVSWY